MPMSLPGLDFPPEHHPHHIANHPLDCYLDILQASQTQNMQNLPKVILMGSDRLTSGFHDTKEYTQFPPH